MLERRNVISNWRAMGKKIYEIKLWHTIHIEIPAVLGEDCSLHVYLFDGDE
ncbi:hypothetical protein [[Limnothrix rosea] IAM M-220]|uniref:hypothetical protein n=1 Tax=[Limnothrix rosea] IAM M-220 TaxID=454133 RepID=UPI0015C56CD1|nr:hypothetical protein [[Limnothrix rosea] IAM M-220]